MKIPKQYKTLEYIHNIEWGNIFAIWKSYESYQKDWQNHWEERGFKLWDEWRQDYISPIKTEKKQWCVYRIKNSSVDIGNIYGVPSKGWKREIYGDKFTIPLSKVVEKIKGGLSDDRQKNEKVETIKNNFPYQTMLTGIINESKIILIEGMHRGVALAMMSEDEIKGDVVIALAEYDKELEVVLGKG